MKKVLIIFFISLLFSTAYSYTASFYEISRSTSGNSNLQDIRVLVREEINDSTNTYNTNRYTDAEINKYINIIHEDVCINTQVLLTQCTGQLTAGTTEYYLPLNFLAFQRVIYDPVNGDTDYLLEEKNPYDMDVDNSGWFTVAPSTPTNYYRYPAYNKIGFYPAPAYSSSVVTIWYIKRPDELTSDTDEIFDSIPVLESFRRAIVVGTSGIIYMQEGNPMYSIKLQEYSGYIENIKKSYDLMPNYDPSIRVYKK